MYTVNNKFKTKLIKLLQEMFLNAWYITLNDTFCLENKLDY